MHNSYSYKSRVKTWNFARIKAELQRIKGVCREIGPYDGEAEHARNVTKAMQEWSDIMNLLRERQCTSK